MTTARATARGLTWLENGVSCSFHWRDWSACKVVQSPTPPHTHKEERTHHIGMVRIPNTSFWCQRHWQKRTCGEHRVMHWLPISLSSAARIRVYAKRVTSNLEVDLVVGLLVGAEVALGVRLVHRRHRLGYVHHGQPVIHGVRHLKRTHALLSLSK